MLDKVDVNRKYLSTTQAAEQFGLSAAHIARLLRTGQLEGFRLGRDRFVYADSIEKYTTSPHKPGPKGPLKKKQAD
jgi:excisionase family DNA binding protein